MPKTANRGLLFFHFFILTNNLNRLVRLKFFDFNGYFIIKAILDPRKMKRNSFALLAPLLAFNEFEVQLYS
jgi:hypothetical protein